MTPPVNTAICLASHIRHRAINNLFLKAKKKGVAPYTLFKIDREKKVIIKNRQGEYERMGVLPEETGLRTNQTQQTEEQHSTFTWSPQRRGRLDHRGDGFHHSDIGPCS